MKNMRSILLILGALALGGVTGCGDDDGDVMPGVDAGPRLDAGGTDSGPGPEDSGPGPDTGPEEDSGMMDPDAGPPSCPALAMRDTVMVAAGDLTSDTTWTCDHIYHMMGQVFVRGATLTIEPGTQIEGEGGSTALVITTTGEINAVGTPVEPIVFTSAMPEGSRMPGDWGGVVLLGLARVNFPGGTSSIEGLNPMEMRGAFGGTDDAHDCGTIQYARIEWAGFEIADGRELNSLSVGGCGSGTTLDHIQTSNGSDDGVEFFGGTASIRHLLITNPGDDGLDWDNGWTGTAQFVIVHQNASQGDNGFEADNNDPMLDTTFALSPRSEPTLWNVTLVGQDDAVNDSNAGMRLRRGTGAHIHNTIVMNFARSSVRLGEVSDQQMAGDLEIRNSIVFDSGPDGAIVDFEAGSDAALAAEFTMGMYMNRTGVNPMLGDPFNEGDPSFVPAATGPASMMAGTPPTGFDTTADYVGAVEPGDTSPWYEGWTAFP